MILACNLDTDATARLKVKMNSRGAGDVRDSGGSLVANPERPVWNGGLRVAVHIFTGFGSTPHPTLRIDPDRANMRGRPPRKSAPSFRTGSIRI